MYIQGKEYIINNKKYIYDGIWNGDYTCDICRKKRWHLHAFMRYDDNKEYTTNYGHFTEAMLFGSECIKKLLTEG